MKGRLRENLIGILFALPWLTGFALFTVYPILLSLYYSFTEFSILRPPRWVGISNYLELFRDENFYKSVWNTAYMTIFGVPLSIVVGLLLAVLVNNKVRGQNVFKVIYFIPSIIPAVAAAILWRWLLNPEYGLINTILNKLGLYQPAWLLDPVWTKPALLLMGVWGTGGIMVIFLAALKDVPRNLYEAAEIDGANRFQKFFNITLPVISPVIFFQVIMVLISFLQYFTQAFIMTTSGHYSMGSGGPQNSMLFYSMYLYYNAFQFLKMGKAAAMAWLLFIATCVITWLVFKSSTRWVFYERGD